MSEEKKLPHIEPAEINTDDLMAKYDTESAFRRLEGFHGRLVVLDRKIGRITAGRWSWIGRLGESRQARGLG